MQIKDIHTSTGLTEVMQSNKTRFSFLREVDGVLTTQTPWMMCRDYFNDILFSNYHPEVLPSSQIYGLCYTQKDNPICLDRVQIAVKIPSKEKVGHLMENIKQLHAVEELLGVETLTEIHEVEDKGKTIVIFADKFWHTKTLSFNLYTQIIKLLMQKHIDLSDNALSEVHYINKVKINNWLNTIQALPHINALQTQFVDSTDKFDSLSYIHNYRGVCTLWGSRSNLLWDCTNILEIVKNISKEKTQLIWEALFPCQADVKVATLS